MNEKPFREIGRELGISQVAAWKLWQQVMEDQVERGQAEVFGARLWQEIHQKADDGDFSALAAAFDRVARHFGIQIARRFLGRIR